MTTYLGKSCSFGLPRVPFVNCRQFMYLVISLLVLRAGCGIWLSQFLIIAYLFTLLCAQWVAKEPRFLHAVSEDSDQTGRMPRLIWVFAGRRLILLVLSCRGSNVKLRRLCLKLLLGLCYVEMLHLNVTVFQVLRGHRCFGDLFLILFQNENYM